MHAIVDEEIMSNSNRLHERLIMLNQSLKGILPVISTQQVDDMLRLTVTTTALAWNWSKGFNY